MELATPSGKGRSAIAGGETDFQPIVTTIAQTYGNAAALRWLNGVKANAGSHIYPDNETVTSEVNSGQVALGVINQYYWYRERHKRDGRDCIRRSPTSRRTMSGT